MDPLSATLGTVALFAPFFKACKRLSHIYHLTQTFGEDYMIVQRLIETQYTRLEQLSQRPVRVLTGLKGINVQDENDPTVKRMISLLAAMKKHSDDCTELMNRYDGPETNTTTLESPNPNTLSHPTKPTSTINPLDTAPLEAPHKVGKRLPIHVRDPWGKSKNHEVPKAAEPPGQTKLENLSSMPGGHHQPSILKWSAVLEEVERQRSEAAIKQYSTPFLRRLVWAQSHKTALTKLAEVLQHGNDEIESLSLPAKIEKPALLLRDSVLTEKLSVTVALVKSALGTLHEALAKLNAPPDTNRHRDHQQTYQLSIQLREDSEVNRKQLLQEPNVQLRDDSYIFNIQRQEDADPQSTADLLFVETLKHPQAQLEKVLNTSSPMPELHDITLPPMIGGGVQTLGFFQTPSARQNTHFLFRDNSKRLCSPLHLADIVSSPGYRDHMSPTQLVQLVRLVMISHLFFSSVRDSLDRSPRLKDFRYFCRAGEKATEWDVEKPLVLRPWLSFGFGSPRRYNLGEEQGVQAISSPSLIELGLVLYQICVREFMDYGPGYSSMTKAKWAALKRLNRIDKAVGPIVTEIVRVLLSPTSLIAAGDKIGEHEETEYILHAITTLNTYEEAIEDTVTDAEKEAAPPSLEFDPERPAAPELPTAQGVGGAGDNDRGKLE